MEPEAIASAEMQLAALLARYDDSLLGRGDPGILAGEPPPELRARLEGDLACLQILQRLRPGTGEATPDLNPVPDGPRLAGRYGLSGCTPPAESAASGWRDDALGRSVALKTCATRPSKRRCGGGFCAARHWATPASGHRAGVNSRQTKL